MLKKFNLNSFSSAETENRESVVFIIFSFCKHYGILIMFISYSSSQFRVQIVSSFLQNPGYFLFHFIHLCNNTNKTCLIVKKIKNNNSNSNKENNNNNNS